MTTFDTINVILLLVLILAMVWLLTEISSLKKELADKTKVDNGDTGRLRLQAYERITMLAERIALQNVLSRVPQPGMSIRQMQGAIIESIRQEYDYNISQQIYVSPEIWKAVNNLKEQNIYIVNQLAATLPSNATGLDLNKQIVDFLINNPKSSMHSMVLEAIAFEAKKLM